MLFTGLGALVAIIGVVVALLLHRRDVAQGIAVTALLCGAFYGALLLASSLTSHERVLRRNEPKYFCGFYLDCHISVAVTNVSTTHALGNAPHQAIAQDTFYVVTIRVSSSAQAATLQPYDLTAVVVDRDGRQYARAEQGEQAPGTEAPLEQPISPGGNSYTRQLVFDLPAGIQQPRLLVTEGHWVDRLLELFLIGDEDSLLHKKTLIRLEPG
jgi:hypothetical protein